MAKRLRHQRIRTSVQSENCTHPAFLSGWLQGRDTYVSLSTDIGGVERPGGVLYGQSLYRLAKAIVRHFEADNS